MQVVGKHKPPANPITWGGRLGIRCRALSLETGKQVWRLETGIPSGRGTCIGSTYFLPLREGVADKDPAVYALDVTRGTILSRSHCPNKEAPGNLLYRDGDLVSQTSTTIALQAARKDEK